MTKERELEEAIQQNDINKVKLLLNNTNFNPIVEPSFNLVNASNSGFIDIIKLLLNDNRIDASQGNNWAIRSSYKRKQYHSVLVLWQDERVKKSLQNDDLKLYKELLKKDIKLKLSEF